MKKRFQRLCAEPRTLKPLCQHLKFDKCAACDKKVKLSQDGLELGPDHHGACDHFLAVDAVVETAVEAPKDEEEAPKKKKSRKKKDPELLMSDTPVLDDEEV